MSRLKILSEKMIDISLLSKENKMLRLDEETQKAGFADCPVSILDSMGNYSYYKLLLSGNKMVIFDKCSHVGLREIKSGFMNGSYCIIESLRGEQGGHKLYILSGHKVLKMPVIHNVETLKDIDDLLCDEEMINLTAKMLNKFSTYHRMQDYEIFVGDLPKGCLQNPKFIDGVLKKFKELGEVQVESVVDAKYINTKACKERAEEYFKSLTNYSISQK